MWNILQEELDELKKENEFQKQLALSTNTHAVKKADKVRKGYKKDTAIKDERLLLSDVAIKMWERFRLMASTSAHQYRQVPSV